MSQNNASPDKPKRIGLCVKDDGWTVQWQNETSIEICGNRCGKVCDGNCIQWSRERKVEQKLGAHAFTYQNIAGAHYDVAVIHDQDIVTILTPAQELEKTVQDLLARAHLSNREAEILLLKLQGYKQKEIADRLFISTATLKTHCKNIRHKIGDAHLNPVLKRVA
ncbi:MAG: hypothetical protein C5B49_14035 [Bdellovibrio sp.]|nr:MAG: hypothetical protein C5B49_14035 [Bdellovibrio sp.]